VSLEIIHIVPVISSVNFSFIMDSSSSSSSFLYFLFCRELFVQKIATDFSLKHGDRFFHRTSVGGGIRCNESIISMKFHPPIFCGSDIYVLN